MIELIKRRFNTSGIVSQMTPNGGDIVFDSNVLINTLWYAVEIEDGLKFLDAFESLRSVSVDQYCVVRGYQSKFVMAPWQNVEVTQDVFLGHACSEEG